MTPLLDISGPAQVGEAVDVPDGASSAGFAASNGLHKRIGS
ncbi:MAG TPA: hypothetical protein VFZ65_05920 [Planctomycetota bacterium]|nr:hypothetical protein [Planctomycetota bacterium]